MEVIAVYDEKIVTTGISRGRLLMLIMELCEDNYALKKVVNLGLSDSLAIHSIAFFENSVYMADSFNNKIYKYDGKSNELSETNVGRDPRHMCLDNENIYVANFESDNISIIDLNSFALTGSIPAGIKAHDVVYSQKNNSLYTSCYEENEVVEYAIDNGLRRSFKTDGKPMHLFLLNDTIIAMTYHVNGNIHTKINFINLKDGNIEDIIIIEGLASDFLLDYENNMLYILNIVDKSLYIVNESLREIVKKVYLGGYPESVSCGGNNIYVTNSKKQQITVIEKKGYNIARSIDLQFVPDLIKVIR
jgi:DNA-binding beta-propeller fold protein YncE